MRLRSEFDAILERNPASRDLTFCTDARDAAGSAPRNIAEGFGRFGHRECARFVSIALGSQHETQTNLMIARDRGYMSDTEFDQLGALSEETIATTVGLMKVLKKALAAGPKSGGRRL
jgi:four helix bundle protein